MAGIVTIKTIIRPVFYLLLVVIIFLASNLSFTTLASINLGGLISEKVLGRSGVTNSSLLLGSAVNNELSILGFAPVVTTQAATDIGLTGRIKTATLHGIVAGMNGMPTATGYFQWGYSPTALTSTTPSFVVSSTGEYTSIITLNNDNDSVYYRFVTDADGTSYGDSATFTIPYYTDNFPGLRDTINISGVLIFLVLAGAGLSQLGVAGLIFYRKTRRGAQ